MIVDMLAVVKLSRNANSTSGDRMVSAKQGIPLTITALIALPMKNITSSAVIIVMAENKSNRLWRFLFHDFISVFHPYFFGCVHVQVLVKGLQGILVRGAA